MRVREGNEGSSDSRRVILLRSLVFIVKVDAGWAGLPFYKIEVPDQAFTICLLLTFPKTDFLRDRI